MRVSIKIQVDNDAFGQTRIEQGMEVARILREYADIAENDGLGMAILQDINGNRVGTVSIGL